MPVTVAALIGALRSVNINCVRMVMVGIKMGLTDPLLKLVGKTCLPRSVRCDLAHTLSIQEDGEDLRVVFAERLHANLDNIIQAVHVPILGFKGGVLMTRGNKGLTQEEGGLTCKEGLEESGAWRISRIKAYSTGYHVLKEFPKMSAWFKPGTSMRSCKETLESLRQTLAESRHLLFDGSQFSKMRVEVSLEGLPTESFKGADKFLQPIFSLDWARLHQSVEDQALFRRVFSEEVLENVNLLRINGRKLQAEILAYDAVVATLLDKIPSNRATPPDAPLLASTRAFASAIGLAIPQYTRSIMKKKTFFNDPSIYHLMLDPDMYRRNAMNQIIAGTNFFAAQEEPNKIWYYRRVGSSKVRFSQFRSVENAACAFYNDLGFSFGRALLGKEFCTPYELLAEDGTWVGRENKEQARKEGKRKKRVSDREEREREAARHGVEQVGKEEAEREIEERESTAAGPSQEEERGGDGRNRMPTREKSRVAGVAAASSSGGGNGMGGDDDEQGDDGQGVTGRKRTRSEQEESPEEGESSASVARASVNKAKKGGLLRRVAKTMRMLPAPPTKNNTASRGAPAPTFQRDSGGRFARASQPQRNRKGSFAGEA